MRNQPPYLLLLPEIQERYSTIEKETLTLLLALGQFEVYVGPLTSPVEIYTDHNPLVFLSCMYNSNQQLMKQGTNLPK